VRGLLVAAVDQEIQAATDNPRPKFKFAGKATLLPGLGAAATAAFAITLSRSAPLSSEQLEDAFLASGISSAPRYDLEEAVPVDLNTLRVRAPGEAATATDLSLFVREDPLFLLRGLRDALTSTTDLGGATALFYGELTRDAPPCPDAASGQLNTAQHRALQDSLAPGVNVVWGPPGTGKTRLLGAFLAEVAAAGRSALLLSNTNVAVDEALLRADELIAGPGFGKLVRVGTPALAAVAEHERLPIDRVVRREFPELFAHRDAIEEQLAVAVQAMQAAQAAPPTLGSGAHTERLAAEHADLVTKRKAVSSEIRRFHREVLTSCTVLATTAASFAAVPKFAAARDREWDYVVIDEASACLYPYLAYAATRARIGVTVVGDFLQNGPISETADPTDPLLAKDVFALLGLDAKSISRPGVTVLDTQHRFPAEVAAVVNRFGYAGQLQTAGAGSGRAFRGLPAAPVLLVDVSRMPPDLVRPRSRPKQDRGTWLAGTVAALELARRVPPGASMGVVTPYAKQATLTTAAFEQCGVAFECGTSHRFQGREFDLVVFDTAQPNTTRGWVLAATFEDSSRSYNYDGARLCNVALTRARSQVAVVVDMNLVRAATGGFLDALRRAEAGGGAQVVDLAALLSASKTVDAPWPRTRFTSTLSPSGMHQALPSALVAAKRSVEVWSDCPTPAGLDAVLPMLEDCCVRGVCVVVHGRSGWKPVPRLRAAGVEVRDDYRRLGKALVVDGCDGFYGSVSLLQPADHSVGWMLRVGSTDVAREFRDVLDANS